MTIKKYKSTTPSNRNYIKLVQEGLSKTPKLKSKTYGKKKRSGRNFSGKITVRHRGGGHKRKYRKILFKRDFDSTGTVLEIEYDPNRNANIASIYDENLNYYYYIIAPKNLQKGDIVISGKLADIKIGHSLPISKIPVGSLIHNINTKIRANATLSRSAGTFSILLEKTKNIAKIKMSSGENLFLSTDCFATIGIVSNYDVFLTKIGKAGRSRWLNKRPKVRGVAMNPVDHPHGGGEGKTSGGRTSSVTPWGKPTKGGATRKFKNIRRENLIKK